jgi:excinuclease ABC subunit C
MIGVAKGPKRIAGAEKLIWAQSLSELDIARDSPARHLIQHVRDEAHRFAISGHRKRRQKNIRKSVLDSIEGIGDKKRQALLRRFGSVKEMKAASMADLMQVPGISERLAEAIYEALH